MAISPAPIVEVRVPTYQRPDMLSHCLDSLIAQTWSNWRAIVFDDSRDHSSEAIVSGKFDTRIIYQRNNERLGAAGNLNQCFQTKSIIPGSLYACCLEDDNWIYPSLFESNIAILRESGCSILMRNQDIFLRDGMNVAATGGTTLGRWFLSDNVVRQIDLHARTFFYTGVSNGALFWKTDARSNLQDPYDVIDPSLQEYIRCWQINEPIYVSLDVASAYSDPVRPTSRHYTKNRSFSRALQHWHGYLIRAYGRQFIDNVLSLSDEFGMRDMAVQKLVNIARPIPIISLLQAGIFPPLQFIFTGVAKRLLVQTPLRLGS